MIVPYMLVRKYLAIPRESTDERSTLLMNFHDMLVQIGFLEFKVIENEKQSRLAIYGRETNPSEKVNMRDCKSDLCKRALAVLEVAFNPLGDT
jgi:hypothetical protein